MRALQFWLLAVAALIVVAGPAFAWAARDYRAHNGYLATTLGERETSYKDMVIITLPDEGPTLRERIFNEKLSKEFRDRYEQQFGRSESERVYYSPNRYSYYNDSYGLRGTPQEITDERRKFGDFMVRRLTEYHVDDYMKNDPRGKTLYEIKEAVSNVKVEVQQFRFDMQYQIAGNTFDMIIVNPYLSMAKFRLQMDPGSFGPGQVQETIVSLGRGITKTIAVEGYWYVNEGITQFIARKTFTPEFSANVTAKTFTKDEEVDRSIRESLYLAGVGYSF